MVFANGVSGQSDPCYDTHHDKESCQADTTTGGGCVWCKCSALPSACFTEENAHKLPSSVYDCDFQENAEPIIEIVQ